MEQNKPRSGSPLAAVEPWNWVADGYTEVTGPKLALYAKEAVEQAALCRQHRVIDIATGPGTVACMVASQVADVVAVDFSPAMVAHCQKRVDALKYTNVRVCEGNGQDLALASDQFDRAFSMFGLMFFPDRVAGFREIYRLLLRGGKAFVTSWAPLSESTLMSSMVEALRVADPSVPPPSSDLSSLENPERFQQEMVDVGFRDVTVQRIYKEWVFDDFDELFDRMVRGSAPLEVMKRAVPSHEWDRRVAVMRNYLSNKLGPRPRGLGSTAWLAQGTK
jgi:ubiquinone/menaquinone biosynthesis C-methylase UbiE